MGLPAGLSSCPKGQDNSGVAAEEPSGLHQRRDLPFGECRPQNPGHKTVGCFGEHGVLKVSQQPGEPEEIPCEGSGRDPLGEGACGDSRVAGVSQGLRRVIGRPF
jgi:hypothetical protein